MLTKASIEAALRLPKASHRKLALASLAKGEWDRCAADPHYWLDAGAHIDGKPYVYTSDPHPMFKCLLCNDEAVHNFHKRKLHLELAHEMGPALSDEVVRAHFSQLSGTRPFTVMPYMPPIIDAWLNNPFFCIEKSRDVMATWLIVALYTWDTIFHSHRQNIFQSETSVKTVELIKRAYFIYRNQPRFLRNVAKANFTIGTSRAGVMVVPSLDSEIIGLGQGPDQIRQYHPSGLFQDEAAFQIQAGDAFAAIKPSLQNGGRFTAISSANPSFFQLLCGDVVVA